jgi:hypothetical protein
MTGLGSLHATLYEQLPDRDLESILRSRAQAKGCELTLSERQGGRTIAAFEQPRRFGRRRSLLLADSDDRRRALLSLLRNDDLISKFERLRRS